GRITAAAADTNRFGGLPLTLGRVETTAPTVGGDDHISTGDGNTVVLGGTGADTIALGSGTNLVVADDGYIDWVANDHDPSDIDLAASTDFLDGGNDVISTGTGDNLVIGGFGADRITGATSNNVIVGDNGQITSAVSNANRYGGLPLTLGRVETTADGIGGADLISTGDGNTVVLGGTGADTIHLGSGTNLVFGDDGVIDWVAS